MVLAEKLSLGIADRAKIDLAGKFYWDKYPKAKYVPENNRYNIFNACTAVTAAAQHRFPRPVRLDRN